ncbi:MAG: hypothetical protein LUI60_06415 [Clostridia bacterium]|nr:hypothetical protein [Clostridia bacterium]
MANALDLDAVLRQNLVDAGCGENLVEQCMRYAKAGDFIKVTAILKGLRNDQLNSLHKEQEKLDCIDFLIFRIGKGDFNDGKM